ncbi:MAG: hypothetical protein AAF203_01990 [Pseudomonadota bacterium]
MKIMKSLKMTLKIVSSIAALAFVTGCDSDGGSSVSNQIDRMGRPAINTALNQTFTDDTTRGAAEDIYNATVNVQTGSTFATTFAAHLAIYDSLVDEGADSNACGDNPFTNLAGTDTSTLATGDSRYSFVAGVLADDQLYIDSSAGGTCTQYLAAEVNVAIGAGLTDCGGRAPTYDVMNVTYSVVAAGGLSGVDDGVDQTDDDSGLSNTTFPFLDAPL